jgi:hypothetical protein
VEDTNREWNLVGTNGDKAFAGQRYSIHDVTIDDIRADYFVGNGTLFQVSNSWDTNVLNSVSINHVTGLPSQGTPFDDRNKLRIRRCGASTSPTTWFLLDRARCGQQAGDTNCASECPERHHACMLHVLHSRCGVIGHRVLMLHWPTSNYFASTPSAFVNFAARNYRLASGTAMRWRRPDGAMLLT